MDKRKSDTNEIIKLILLVIIISMALFCPKTYGKENISGTFFKNSKKENIKESGYYYYEINGKTYSLPDVSLTDKFGSYEKDLGENADIYYLKENSNFSSLSNNIQKYTEYFDLSNYEEIKTPYNKNLPTDEETLNELMWLLNNISLVSNEESKDSILDSAGLDRNVFKTFLINGKSQETSEKDIIKTIQQVAILNLINKNVETIPNIYVSSTNEVNKKINLNEAFKNYDDAVNKLYAYFINGAVNAVRNNNYSHNKIENNIPYILIKDNATIEKIDSNYVMGPYKIQENLNDYDFNVSINDGNTELTNVKILGSDKTNEVEGANTLEKIKASLNNEFYLSIPISTSATKINISLSGTYNKKSLIYYSQNANELSNSIPLVMIKNEKKKLYYSHTKAIDKSDLDFALREFITAVNGNILSKSREPHIAQTDFENFVLGKSSLDSGSTIEKSQNKDEISVNTGDIITYTIRVYNEGKVNGYVNEIVSHIPDGMEYIEDSSINNTYGWVKDSNNDKIIRSNYLNQTILNAFSGEKVDNKYSIDYKDISLELRVTGETKSTDTILKDISEISKISSETNNSDKDSNPDNLTDAQLEDYNPGTSSIGKGFEDDDDYDVVTIKGKYFDLALRQFITKVVDENNNAIEYKREPTVDTNPLLVGETTANYKGTKSPVGINANDTIYFTIRVYNEGQVDGYADEIVMHLPEELEFINDEENADNGWIIDTTDETKRTLKTKKLSKDNDEDNYIKAFDENENKLSYKDIELKCKVKGTTEARKEITNIAEITKSSNNLNLADRDDKKNVSIPSDNDLSSYIGNTENKTELSDSNYYYKGQEDDDDFEKVIFEKFDLALRVFETKQNEQEVLDRNPITDATNFNKTVDGKYITTCSFNQKKDVINVEENDILEFTIRVYNEGTQDGYAQEIRNEIPAGLEFIEDNDINKQYQWKMYNENNEETTNKDECKYVLTTYLAKETTNSNNDQNNNSEVTDNKVLKAYDKSKNPVPDFKDIKIVLKVISIPNGQDRNIIEQAQISKDADINGADVTDIDSSTNELNENDDDEDQEKLYEKKFDFCLSQKIVSEYIIESGNETESRIKDKDNDNHLFSDTINKSQIENNVIKFKYQITVKNEGDIPGYVKEITDYLPDGMTFNQADNLDWTQSNNSDNIVSNKKLRNTLISSGESKTIELILTLDNENGVNRQLLNVCEIKSVTNTSNSVDIDSTPNNKADGEDDIDNTEINISTLKYNINALPIVLAIVLIITGAMIFVIKRYIL